MMRSLLVTLLLSSTALGFVPVMPIARAPFGVLKADAVVEEEATEAPAAPKFKASFAKGELAGINSKIAKAEASSFAGKCQDYGGITQLY